jgi:hypothetical protein
MATGEHPVDAVEKPNVAERTPPDDTATLFDVSV